MTTNEITKLGTDLYKFIGEHRQDIDLKERNCVSDAADVLFRVVKWKVEDEEQMLVKPVLAKTEAVL